MLCSAITEHAVPRKSRDEVVISLSDRTNASHIQCVHQFIKMLVGTRVLKL